MFIIRDGHLRSCHLLKCSLVLKVTRSSGIIHLYWSHVFQSLDDISSLNRASMQIPCVMGNIVIHTFCQEFHPQVLAKILKSPMLPTSCCPFEVKTVVSSQYVMLPKYVSLVAPCKLVLLKGKLSTS